LVLLQHFSFPEGETNLLKRNQSAKPNSEAPIISKLDHGFSFSENKH
jgi:hypothetical protein